MVDNRRVLTFIFDSLHSLKQKRFLNKKTRPSPNLKLSLVHFIDLLGNRFLVAFMHLKCYLCIRQGLTTTRLILAWPGPFLLLASQFKSLLKTDLVVFLSHVRAKKRSNRFHSHQIWFIFPHTQSYKIVDHKKLSFGIFLL